MHSLHEDFSAGLFEKSGPPCISLYQPTHRSFPDSRQDPIRFRNLVKEAEESLRKAHSPADVEALLEPFAALAGDESFWNRSLDGLAVLAAPGMFRVYRMQRTVPELAIVADSFHVKPLLRILQSADRYQILCVTRDEINLFEGNRDELDEIELGPDMPRTSKQVLGEEPEATTERQERITSYSGRKNAPLWHGFGDAKDQVGTDTERFFRAVDRAVTETYSNPSRLPLLLVALSENQAVFRRVSRNQWLMAGGLDADPKALTREELRARTWEIVQPHYLSRLESLVERFGETHGTGLGTDAPEAAARAAVAGRVETLLVEAERQLAGRIAANGSIEWGDLAHPQLDDVLDDIASVTLRHGGEVVVVPAERMPTDTGLAAIFRY